MSWIREKHLDGTAWGRQTSWSWRRVNALQVFSCHSLHPNAFYERHQLISKGNVNWQDSCFCTIKQHQLQNLSIYWSSKNNFLTQVWMLFLPWMNPRLDSQPVPFLTGWSRQQRLTRTPREKWTSWRSWGHGTPRASWTPWAPRPWMYNRTWIWGIFLHPCG